MVLNQSLESTQTTLLPQENDDIRMIEINTGYEIDKFNVLGELLSGYLGLSECELFGSSKKRNLWSVVTRNGLAKSPNRQKSKNIQTPWYISALVDEMQADV